MVQFRARSATRARAARIAGLRRARPGTNGVRRFECLRSGKRPAGRHLAVVFLDPAFGYTANSFNRNWVTHMTYEKILAALVAGTLTVFGVGAFAQKPPPGAEPPEQAKVLKHAEEAVAAGKQGDAAGLLEHAEEAQKYAIMAQKEFSSFKLQTASGHLAQAITHGKQGDAVVATTHAEEAVKALKSAYPDDPGQP